jgi:hypothetical protein
MPAFIVPSKLLTEKFAKTITKLAQINYKLFTAVVDIWRSVEVFSNTMANEGRNNIKVVPACNLLDNKS